MESFWKDNYLVEDPSGGSFRAESKGLDIQGVAVAEPVS